MMLKQGFVKIYAMALVASILVISSCQEDVERLSLQDTADITEEALTTAYFQDLDDMAGVAMVAPSDAEYSSGRTSGSLTIEIDDARFKCAGIVVTIETDVESTPEHPKGVITVDFGTAGCLDQRNNTRKGKVMFAYDGWRFMPGSTVVTTTDNYFINGIKLEGTRTLTNIATSTSSAPRFNVVLANGKATFPNGTFATRQSDITTQWNRAESPLDDNLTVEMTSTASGTTRAGRSYEVSLLEDVVYKRHCGIAVSGIKKYVIDGTRERTIDYGDGTCDKAVTVTVNGVTREITF